ncbi:MAG: glutamate racemase [Candidatus Pacebacteria bacterium]|nr:glutamate racemase [Candidatus Paceibacterota bacterium]
MSQEKRIGIFDSGFGGLDVTRAIVAALPEYEYLYLGDTARAPYGDRSQETIYAFTKQAVEFLFAHDCELVILACNTASSEALRKIQQEYLPRYAPDKRVLGVLIPAAEDAMEKSSGKKIGVIATTGTVASGAYTRELAKFDQGVQVFQNACPLLVPIVESGEQDSPETFTVLERYLAPLLREHIDTLILGCTHYGILESQIRTIVGPNVTIISSAAVVPDKLRAYLARHPELEAGLSKGGSIRFFSTDATDTFKRLGSKLFERDIEVEKVSLG